MTKHYLTCTLSMHVTGDHVWILFVVAYDVRLLKVEILRRQLLLKDDIILNKLIVTGMMCTQIPQEASSAIVCKLQERVTRTSKGCTTLYQVHELWSISLTCYKTDCLEHIATFPGEHASFVLVASHTCALKLFHTKFTTVFVPTMPDFLIVVVLHALLLMQTLFPWKLQEVWLVLTLHYTRLLYAIYLCSMHSLPNPAGVM